MHFKQMMVASSGLTVAVVWPMRGQHGAPGKGQQLQQAGRSCREAGQPG